MKNLNDAIISGMADATATKSGDLLTAEHIASVIKEHVAGLIREKIRLAKLKQPRAEGVLDAICNEIVK